MLITQATKLKLQLKHKGIVKIVFFFQKRLRRVNSSIEQKPKFLVKVFSSPSLLFLDRNFFTSFISVFTVVLRRNDAGI